jgi:Ca-activated chloride channel family protein
MKHFLLYIILFTSTFSFSQNQDEASKKLNNKAISYVADANQKVEDNFVEAEMDYRKAISVKPSSVAGTYNLAHSYYKNENYEEALFRNQQAAQNATDKLEKQKAFHNIGNILMKNKKCKDAVEAFKNALRNNPKDNETRYNLALAQECAKGQQDEPQEEDKDGENDKNKDENKDEENKENNDKKEEDKGDDKEDKGDDGDKKDEENKDKDENGDPKDDKKNEGDKGDEEQQQPQQQKGQLSPQQIKNLLEAMENEEQKVQDKINAQKAKGAKIETEKDW